MFTSRFRQLVLLITILSVINLRPHVIRIKVHTDPGARVVAVAVQGEEYERTSQQDTREDLNFYFFDIEVPSGQLDIRAGEQLADGKVQWSVPQTVFIQ